MKRELCEENEIVLIYMQASQNNELREAKELASEIENFLTDLGIEHNRLGWREVRIAEEREREVHRDAERRAAERRAVHRRASGVTRIGPQTALRVGEMIDRLEL